MHADLNEANHCFDGLLMENPSQDQTKLLSSAKNNLKKMAYFGIKEYPLESAKLFENTFNISFKKPLFDKQHPYRLTDM
jgi:hypothetical protein